MALDLTDLSLDGIEVVETGTGVALESLVSGHAMSEVGASVIGAEMFLCSCCCCC